MRNAKITENAIIAEKEMKLEDLDTVAGGKTFAEASDPKNYDTSIFSFPSRIRRLFGW